MKLEFYIGEMKCFILMIKANEGESDSIIIMNSLMTKVTKPVMSWWLLID